MTDKKELIDGIIKLLKNYEFGVPIERFLKSKGVPPEKFDELINEAESILKEKEITITAIKSKILFGLWILLSILTVYLFYFVLPHTNMKTFPGFFSVIGTALFVLFSYLAFAYYKSWDREYIRSNKSPRLLLPIFLFLATPGVIVYFIFFWH